MALPRHDDTAAHWLWWLRFAAAVALLWWSLPG
jgi:hypothetical protein